MVKQVLFGAIAASAIAFTAHAAPSTPSLWEHNGSTVYLLADGANREFRYDQPRPGMLGAGAQPDSLLFTGRSVGGRYVGTAYIFHRDCGQFPYQVSGPILDNDKRVVLRGQAPRVDANCNIRGYFADVLEFSFLRVSRTRPDIRDSYAYAPPPSWNPGQLVSGTELVVVNVGPNDVLHIREYATDNSPIVGFIPPNAQGITYLGESQGQWIFVRYEDQAEGWVNRRLVQPIPTRGRRLQ